MIPVHNHSRCDQGDPAYCDDTADELLGHTDKDHPGHDQPEAEKGDGQPDEPHPHTTTGSAGMSDQPSRMARTRAAWA